MKFWSLVLGPWSVVLLLSAGAARGQSQLAVEMPLGPYWRAGKYVPVRLVATVERGNKWVGLVSSEVEKFPRGDVGGRGAGRTSVMIPDQKLDAVVPWLVMDSRAKRPRFFVEHSGEFVEGPELRQLGDSERLVGFATSVDEGMAKKLAIAAAGDAAKAISVPLDPLQPLKGHAAAWELLDAIVLDSASAARLDDAQISALLSCGVAVAVGGEGMPRNGQGGWPWSRDGEYWVLRHSLAGPVTAGEHPAAYAPVANWRSGWRWPFRRRVLLFGVVVCLVLLGLALWRPPWVVLWIVLMVAGASIALGKWWQTRLTIQQAGGEVVVIGGQSAGALTLTQTDGWTYQTSIRDSVATLRWTEVSRPVFASRRGLDDVWISLNCDTSGRPSEFDARIPAGRRVAYLSRSVGTVAPKVLSEGPANSPLEALVREGLYRGRIVGQLGAAPPNSPAYGMVEMEQWGAIVVERAKRDE